VCDAHDRGLPPLETDEWILDTPRVRSFVEHVRAVIDAAASPGAACAALTPGFAELLADESWLPERFQTPVPGSGMGGGIGQWLLFRAADRSLCLFSLVVPPGSMTPIHDHLAWGLVGLYRGAQDEEFYAPAAGTIECTRRRPLAPGDHYALLPPHDDVHRVRTTSMETSVSIHLLANDAGCIARHTFDERTGAAAAFVSGYVNAECSAPGRVVSDRERLAR
jgi:predicted metal-dependent enzyme (double-stranded beta helix superfamily)